MILGYTSATILDITNLPGHPENRVNPNISKFLGIRDTSYSCEMTKPATWYMYLATGSTGISSFINDQRIPT